MSDEGAKGRPGDEGAPNGHRVHEIADHRHELRFAAREGRRSDDDVFRAGQAREERVKRGEDHDERRRVLLLCDVLEPLGERRADIDGNRCALQHLPVGSRAIRRQVEMCARRRQLLTPVRPQPLAFAAGQPLALPRRVVGVGHGGPARAGRGAARRLCVQRAELLKEQEQRPAVDRDVVDRDEQNVIERRARVHRRAQNRPALEIERPMKVGEHDVTQFRR